jgi:hypothetical protein
MTEQDPTTQDLQPDLDVTYAYDESGSQVTTDYLPDLHPTDVVSIRVDADTQPIDMTPESGAQHNIDSYTVAQSFYKATSILAQFRDDVAKTHEDITVSASEAIDDVNTAHVKERALKEAAKNRMQATLDAMYQERLDHDTKVRDTIINKNNRIKTLTNKFTQHNSGAQIRLAERIQRCLDLQSEHEQERDDAKADIDSLQSKLQLRIEELVKLEQGLAELEKDLLEHEILKEKKLIKKAELEVQQDGERSGLITADTMQRLIDENSDPRAFARKLQAEKLTVSSASLSLLTKDITTHGEQIDAISKHISELDGPDGMIEAFELQVRATKTDIEKLPKQIEATKAKLKHELEVVAPRLQGYSMDAKNVMRIYGWILEGKLTVAAAAGIPLILSEVYKAAVNLENELAGVSDASEPLEWASSIFDLDIPAVFRENPDDASTSFEVQTHNNGEEFTKNMERANSINPINGFPIDGLGLSIDTIKRGFVRAGERMKIRKNNPISQPEA